KGVVRVPFPPTTNNLYVNVRGKGRVRSKAYRTWQESAGWLVATARLPKFDGPVKVRIELCPANHRRVDADNRIKAVMDLLVTREIIKGDDSRFVRSVTAEFVESVHSCTVHIEGVE